MEEAPKGEPGKHVQYLSDCSNLVRYIAINNPLRPKNSQPNHTKTHYRASGKGHFKGFAQ